MYLVACNPEPRGVYCSLFRLSTFKRIGALSCASKALSVWHQTTPKTTVSLEGTLRLWGISQQPGPWLKKDRRPERIPSVLTHPVLALGSAVDTLVPSRKISTNWIKYS